MFYQFGLKNVERSFTGKGGSVIEKGKAKVT
jgi:hypothetical protein